MHFLPFFCTLIVLSEASLSSRSSTSLQIVTKSVESFTIKFYKMVLTRRQGNLITAPLSAHIVLSMAALGANENTKRQLHQVLDFEVDDRLIKIGYQDFINEFNDVKNMRLEIFNKIFISNNIAVKPEFRSMTKNIFRSEIEELDFSNPVRATFTMNEWFASQTSNKIENVVGLDSLDRDMKMILVSAVHFKGQWKKKFNPSATDNSIFFTNQTHTKMVPTMYQTAKIAHGVVLGQSATFAKLPFAGDKLSMIIVLPYEFTGLEELEGNLESLSPKYLEQFEVITKTDIYLPKFKIENTIELNDILSDMGMREMFLDNADFSGISENPLKVSKVVQKAFIEVDEEGIKGGASGRLKATILTSLRSNHATNIFNVNKPFMYFLVYRDACNTETVILKGKCTDPEI